MTANIRGSSKRAGNQNGLGLNFTTALVAIFNNRYRKPYRGAVVFAKSEEDWVVFHTHQLRR